MSYVTFTSSDPQYLLFDLEGVCNEEKGPVDCLSFSKQTGAFVYDVEKEGQTYAWSPVKRATASESRATTDAKITREVQLWKNVTHWNATKEVMKLAPQKTLQQILKELIWSDEVFTRESASE